MLLLDRQIPASGIVELCDGKFTKRQVRRARTGFRPDLEDKINATEINLNKAEALEKKEQTRLYLQTIRRQLMSAIKNLKDCVRDEESVWDQFDHGQLLKKDNHQAARRVMQAMADHQAIVAIARKHHIFTDYEGIKEIKANRVKNLRQRTHSRKQSQENAVNDAASVGAVA